MVASAGETARDLAWTQLAQKLCVYNIVLNIIILKLYNSLEYFRIF